MRSIHGLLALYFISCIIYIYFAAITLRFDTYLIIAVLSLIIEGVLVFLLNKGDCPLIHIQRKIGDEKPFFELFLPKKIAKKTIPFFLYVTYIGVILLVIRFIIR